MKRNPLFGQMLVARGAVSEEMYQRLEARYEEDAFAILQHLVRTEMAAKDILGRCWADALGISYVDMRRTLFQRQVVQRLPENYARKHNLILIYQFGDAITAAMSNPTDKLVIKGAAELVGLPISPVFAFPEEIENAIEIEYKTADHLNDLSRRIITDTIRIEDISELTQDQLQKVAGTQAVVEFAYGLLLLGVREKASDIHIEPAEENVRVRFRIDGVLQERSRMEKALLAPIVSRLKILAVLDITEKRRPQDGRITLKLPSRSIDFRVSFVPSIYGEKVVLRILGQTQARDIPSLADLGFSKPNLDLLKKIVQVPHGIVFVTGPTGSGKTTTLFSVLKHLNKPGVNVTTIEDPIEYRLAGITQVQVNTAVDLDFAAALRVFLRQDPDIILVGEIRDMETAQIACQAALTGHLVLATLHTNSAVQAVTRLVDMGVKPFLVAPSLIGVMAQRLVRRICDNCREKYLVPPEEVRDLFVWEGRELYFYRGRGCASCNETGYSGRIAIHEVVNVDDQIRTMIARGDTVSEIQRCAKKIGFQSMRYDGLKKVLRGLTTLEEINRVTVAEEESGMSEGS